MLRIIFIILSFMFFVGSAHAAEADSVVGTWRNVRNTMHIQVSHCGEFICGKVIWASAEANADARRGGTQSLIGTEIFRDFRQDGSGKWTGKLFVPDISKTLSGTIEFADHNTLKGRGCLIGGVFCKSKILVRM